jgi:hypothetical protein
MNDETPELSLGQRREIAKNLDMSGEKLLKDVNKLRTKRAVNRLRTVLFASGAVISLELVPDKPLLAVAFGVLSVYKGIGALEASRELQSDTDELYRAAHTTHAVHQSAELTSPWWVKRLIVTQEPESTLYPPTDLGWMLLGNMPKPTPRPETPPQPEN